MRWKSRAGRPAPELKRLIRRMATGSPPWSEERIAHELLVELRIRVDKNAQGLKPLGKVHKY